jgi:RNA polymerase sigma-70 factor (ECF subfamily)
VRALVVPRPDEVLLVRRLFESDGGRGGDAGEPASSLDADLLGRRRRARGAPARDGVTAADPRLADLAGAREGDPDAIGRLYRALQPRLMRMLRVEVGDAADDVASQTWLEVVGALRRFEGDFDGFRALLFTIARRRVADHRRTRRRRPATPTEPVAFNDRLAATDDTEQMALADVGGRWAVERIVELLPPDHAEIVLLRVVADLPVEQVARILGRPAGTIRVQQHRALKRLAAALGGNEGALRGDEAER